MEEENLPIDSLEGVTGQPIDVDTLEEVDQNIAQAEEDRQIKLQILENLPLDGLPPEVRSVLTGALIGGVQGMMDAAVVIGLEKIPSELRGIVEDLIGDINWMDVPGQIADLFDSFFNETGPGLISKLGDFVSGIDLSNLDIGGVFDKIFSGDFGDVTKFLSDLGSVPFLSNLLPGTGILNSVSTILGIFDGGIGNVFNNLFSNGGFGLTAVLNVFGVSSTLTGLIGPLLGLFGLGGANSKCPCDPSCRKTDHFITEDGKKLLEKCSSVIPNSSSTYLPYGGSDITNNNNNPFSQILGLVQTGLGESLIPPNLFNLTEFITGVNRVGKMAERVESARNADFPDWQNELVYTFKAIENGFKVNDNNVTKMEEILSLFTRGQLFSQFFSKARDEYVFEVLEDMALSIADLQRQTTTLDAVKVGGYAGAVPTSPIVKTKTHAGIIPTAKVQNKLDWKKILEILELALSILNLLKPGNDPENAEALKSKLENNRNINEDDPFAAKRQYGDDDGMYDFPSINIAFPIEELKDEYSEPEKYQKNYDDYTNPSTALTTDFESAGRNNPILPNSILWGEIISNKFTQSGLVEQIGGSVTIDENGDARYVPPENTETNAYLDPLKKIFEYYEQETNSGEKIYC